MGGVEELLELRVGHRILVDIERLDVHRVLVKAARAYLPTDIARRRQCRCRLRSRYRCTLKTKSAARNPDHALGRACAAALVGGISTSLLRQRLPFGGVAGQRLAVIVLSSLRIRFCVSASGRPALRARRHIHAPRWRKKARRCRLRDRGVSSTP